MGLIMNVPSVSSETSATLGERSPLPVQTLDQDDFLKLLVAQFTSQDPLNPKQDTEFIAQMAQFSALEQAKSMQADISRLRSEQQLLQANALLGRAVEVQTSENLSAVGTVEAVQVEAGTPKIVVDGQAYELQQLIAITPALVS
jgi:flagellar basal-body rod modification protein FlgD